MKSLAALALLSFMSTALAEDSAPASICATTTTTTTTQPTITVHSCPRESSTSTFISPSEKTGPSSPAQPDESGVESGYASLSPSVSSPNGGNSNSNNSHDGSGNSNIPEVSNTNISGSASSGSVAVSEHSPNAPSNTNEPETVPVASAYSASVNTVILFIAGMIPAIMGWF
ncbi:hypothetical protein NM208_g7532 [Fusarium decemcellulare]|uniref:Uncharacterized protein n=1 Tax=Fusarium decemcellulare TaxID=57161 RepID=A0ACC1S8T8_9HYPO|nr:hypothetical protein NM208_g7532 [Fusarium decemcellulare]